MGAPEARRLSARALESDLGRIAALESRGYHRAQSDDNGAASYAHQVFELRPVRILGSNSVKTEGILIKVGKLGSICRGEAKARQFAN